MNARPSRSILLEADKTCALSKESGIKGPGFELPLKEALHPSDLKVPKVQSATKVPKIVVSLRSIFGKK